MKASLDKSPALLDVLRRLRERLGDDAFVIADHWELDLDAIGIASPHDPRYLIYVSVYREPLGCFNYECEIPAAEASEMPYEVQGRGSGVSFDALAGIVERHLALARGPAEPFLAGRPSQEKFMRIGLFVLLLVIATAWLWISRAALP